MDHTLEKILTRVQKPGRYVGGEYNAVQKEKQTVDCRFAFCFPDVYEVGMSHLGSRILYGLLNDQKNIWCERVFAPWIDMEQEMRAAGIRLTIVSNNTAKRVRPFAERIGLDWVPLACKPLTIGLAVARHRLGVKKSQMAMVGDQIFADRMAAGLYGCPCLYLLPRAPGDRNKFVQFKRKYEPYWLDRYYKKGGVVHE